MLSRAKLDVVEINIPRWIVQNTETKWREGRPKYEKVIQHTKTNSETVVQSMNICEKVVQSKKNGEKVVQDMNICEKVVQHICQKVSTCSNKYRRLGGESNREVVSCRAVRACVRARVHACMHACVRACVRARGLVA